MKKFIMILGCVVSLSTNTPYAFSQSQGTLNVPDDTCYIIQRFSEGNVIDAELTSYSPTTNYGSSTSFIANAWTFNGTFFTERSVLKFDLPTIPPYYTIVSARLSLYCNTTSDHTQLQSPLSGSNSAYILRVTSPWAENSVTWNNQPTTSTQNMVTLPQSTSNTQDYPNIDVTNLIFDMYSNPNSSYGFMIQLVTEVNYRCLVFASSEHSNVNIRPRLEICCKAATSINPYDKLTEIEIFPNPVTNEITILGFENENKLLEIVDFSGKTITRIESYENKIDVSFLPSGVYYLRISSNERIKQYKLLKI